MPWWPAPPGSTRRPALLEAVSIVPGTVPLPLVTALGREHADRLDTCLASGMLVESRDGISFRHDLARAAIADEIEPLRRAGLHRIALETLRAQGADAARLAHHAEAAGDVDAIVQFAPIAAAQATARRCASRGGGAVPAGAVLWRRAAARSARRPAATRGACQLPDRPVRRGHRVAPGGGRAASGGGRRAGRERRAAPALGRPTLRWAQHRRQGHGAGRRHTSRRGGGRSGAGGRVRQPGHVGAEQQRVRRLRRGGRSGSRAGHAVRRRGRRRARAELARDDPPAVRRRLGAGDVAGEPRPVAGGGPPRARRSRLHPPGRRRGSATAAGT